MSQPLPSSREIEADRAAASGDLSRAEQILTVELANAPTFAVALKLAGLRRALKRPAEALEATLRALEFAPLDFTALVLRASLTDELDPDAAGRAWDEALAQRPSAPLGPQLASVVAAGERRRALWLEARESRLNTAIGASLSEAAGDEDWRIRRFRDNILRRTHHYPSRPTHYHFPDLREREFHPPAAFPWLRDLEAATEIIAEELQTVLQSERTELVPYVQYAAHQPLDQWRSLNHNRDWTAIHLLRNGRPVDANIRHCPKTIALLAGLDQPAIRGASPNAMFSLLAPQTKIPAHVGVSNARLICHLPLVVPPGCWFRVGAETREWRRGEAFVFDDTIEHEAANPTDELRIVLIFDIWHPGLTATERAAVTALVEAETDSTAVGL